MRRRPSEAIAAALVTVLLIVHPREGAGAAETSDLRAVVTRAVEPVMQRYAIPGMAVGVTVDGHDYVFHYGVASRATRRPVDASTLFEVGSFSKTFTATLVSYAEVTKKLSFYDRVGADFPALRGTRFDHVQLVHLATHTAGGLPLQFPDDVVNDDDALRYYARWKPSHAAGTYRLYSNPSIMLLGVVTAKRLGSNFESLMQQVVIEPLRLRNTFLTVPSARLPDYAQGYTDRDVPTRMSPGPLAPEAYGIRTTAGDVLRFIDANMDLLPIGNTLQRALDAAHTGYYRLGAMTQDVIWEQYRYPVALTALLQGNSNQVVLGDNAVAAIKPPSPPQRDVLLDKTGSTNGFATYAAFVPRLKIGIVLLANKSYPAPDRIATAYRILSQLHK